MSADNGIYILNFKDESRVIHAGAIDNLNWDYKTMRISEEFNPWIVYQYFNDAKSFKNEKEALLEAEEMSKEVEILEYGICVLGFIDKTFLELTEDAKIYINETLPILKSKNTNNWDSDIKEMEELILKR